MKVIGRWIKHVLGRWARNRLLARNRRLTAKVYRMNQEVLYKGGWM